MYSISSFSLAKLNNAEFVAYFVNLKQLLETEGAETLGLETGVMTHFGTVLQKLIDQVYATQGSQYTITMKAADESRDIIYRRILLRLSLVTLADKDSTLLRLKDVVETALLSKYSPSVVSMPQHEESAVLTGFIHDLRTFLEEDDLDDMGISSDVSSLELANNSFITAYNNRSNERATGDTGLTVKLRTEMLDVNAQICFNIQYLANSTLEANATKAAACQSAISSINVVLADVQKRWKQRTGGVESSDANVPEGGNEVPSGGNDVPSGSSEDANTPAGGNDNPGGGNDTPGGSENPDGGVIHDGAVEF